MPKMCFLKFKKRHSLCMKLLYLTKKLGWIGVDKEYLTVKCLGKQVRNNL